jgi:transcription-repair coupling factor (superfamily II helicase)
MAQAQTTKTAQQPHAVPAFRPGEEIVLGAPDGFDAAVLARLADEASAFHGTPQTLLHVAADDRRLEQLETGLAFFAPKTRIISIPAWDTVPYDRVGPEPEIVARRMAGLARLVAGTSKTPTIVLTTANAVLQRVPSRDFLRRALRPMAPGQRVDRSRLIDRLTRAGYVRTGTVMEPGEFAVRGSLVDLFPPGRTSPVRLDFFGDTIESIKAFDPETQRTGKIVQRLVLMPVSELSYGPEAESRFRQGYVAAFGAVKGDDPLYEAISAGQRYPGMEHWLALFHDHMETLFDYAPDALISFDPMMDETIADRLEQIRDHYEARVNGLETTAFGAAPYKPLPPDRTYLNDAEWRGVLARRFLLRLTAFGAAPSEDTRQRDFGGRPGRTFATERNSENVNVFDAVVAHVKSLQASGRRVILAAWTTGAGERLANLLTEHGLAKPTRIANLAEGLVLPQSTPLLATLGLERGFETSASRTFSAIVSCARRSARAAPPTSSPRRRASRPAISSCIPITALAVSWASRPSRRWAPLTTAWRSTTRAATSSTCPSRTSSSCRDTVRTRRMPSSTVSAASAGRRVRPSSASASARSPAS